MVKFEGKFFCPTILARTFSWQILEKIKNAKNLVDGNGEWGGAKYEKLAIFIQFTASRLLLLF